MLINKIKSIFIILEKLIKTQSKLKGISSIEKVALSNIEIRSYTVNDEKEIAYIYEKLNRISLSKYHKILYKTFGDKILFLATDVGNKEIVGMDMFYFNPRDFTENTIHEGFIGVLPDSEGQGIATQMRQEAIKHFKKYGLSGISTRISKNNLGSLHSAEKLGFTTVEEYFDSITNEERYYMVLSF